MNHRLPIDWNFVATYMGCEFIADAALFDPLDLPTELPNGNWEILVTDETRKRNLIATLKPIKSGFSLFDYRAADPSDAWETYAH